MEPGSWPSSPARDGERTSFWSVSLSIWLAVVLSAVVASGALVGLSDAGMESAMELVLHAQARSEARLVARLVALGDSDLGSMVTAVDAGDAAIFGPDGSVVQTARGWRVGVDPDLLRAAAAGEEVLGPMVEDADDTLFQAAYVPVPGRDGWVVAVESRATMGALERLEIAQTTAAIVVVLLVGASGFGLAALVARPLRRLEVAVQSARPGEPPDRIPVAGPREVRAIGANIRGLMEAIRDRDAEVLAAHRSEVGHLVRLSAEVAHEIRNPLHTLTLSIGRLASVEDRASRERIAGRVDRQLQQLEVIVRRLLDLNRPLAPALEPVALKGAVQAVADEVGITLGWGGGEAIVTADPVLLAEILRNLALNASQAGASALSALVSVTDGRVVLVLEDDGPGLDGDPEEVFEWFHTTRARGSGLGLPTSRRIAVAMDGSLTCVRARPATFRLELPEEEA